MENLNEKKNADNWKNVFLTLTNIESHALTFVIVIDVILCMYLFTYCVYTRRKIRPKIQCVLRKLIITANP